MSGSASFPTTRWHLIRCAASLDPAEREAALEQLASLYWEPLYAYARRCGYGHEEASDLLQEFLSRFCEQGHFGSGNIARGRFRNFLLSSKKHFAVDLWRTNQTTARRPPGGWVPLETSGREEALSLRGDTPSPDVEFDRNWLRGILERNFEGLRLHYAKNGRQALGEHFCAHLMGDPNAEKHEKAAGRLGLSHDALRQEMTRARKHLQSLIVSEVTATVGSPREVEEELRYLFAVWDQR